METNKIVCTCKDGMSLLGRIALGDYHDKDCALRNETKTPTERRLTGEKSDFEIYCDEHPPHLNWKERFDEQFLRNVKDSLGWNLPRIGLYWQESGKSVEWEDMEKELKTFIETTLAQARSHYITEIERIEHGRFGMATDMGYMQAKKDIINLLKQE